MRKASGIFNLYIVIGALIGYLFLHPASYLIIDFSEGNFPDFSHILTRSFAFSHLTMALYFSLLGGLIGLLFSLYSNLEKKVYSDMTDLNRQIGDRASNLAKSLDPGAEDLSLFIKQIWPILNRIQAGVNIVSDDKSEISARYRNELFTATKDNISSVFNLIDVMLAYEQNSNPSKS